MLVPGEQYERFYQHNLRTKASEFDKETLALLRRALAETKARRYHLSHIQQPVPPQSSQ